MWKIQDFVCRILSLGAELIKGLQFSKALVLQQ